MPPQVHCLAHARGAFTCPFLPHVVNELSIRQRCGWPGELQAYWLSEMRFQWRQETKQPLVATKYYLRSPLHTTEDQLSSPFRLIPRWRWHWRRLRGGRAQFRLLISGLKVVSSPTSAHLPMAESFLVHCRILLCQQVRMPFPGRRQMVKSS